MKFDKLLILIDDSPASIRAAKCGYELAKNLNAKVALLSVVEMSAAEGNVDAGIFPEQAGIKLKEHAEELLDHICEDYSRGVPTEKFVPFGDTKHIIIETAREWEAGMIVLGSHGRTGLEKLLVGSVAEYAIRHSPVPVFIVPKEQK